MLFALLLATAPVSAIDIERAFAADAQKSGQWTAFRRFAAPNAVMFVPQPTNAQAWLRGRKNPQASVFWWPGRSYVSCDGKTAINTGPWVRGYGKSVGYFTTVWVRQKDGAWKWVYDGGDEDKFMRDEGGDIAPVIALCKASPQLPASPQPPKTFAGPFKSGGGASLDGTLSWSWIVDASGQRQFVAQVLTDRGWQSVIDDKVAAAPK